MAEVRAGYGVLQGAGEVRLAYRAWEPPGAARAGLVVVHGLGEHGGRYEDFATVLAAAGIATYALDLRGHGRSGGRRGHMPSFDAVLQDVERFRREVATRAGAAVPLFILGHSMGGLIATRYLQEYGGREPQRPDQPAPGGQEHGGRFRGAIIISPWLATAMPVPRWKLATSRTLGRLLPSLPIPHGLRTEHLSRDPAIVRAYDDDPLTHGYITPRAFVEVSAAMDLAVQRSARLALPLLFLLAGDDRIVDTDHALRFARAIRAGDVTIDVYHGSYHEVLNDYDRKRAFSQVRDWVVARLHAA
jgi:lysophospholipase